MIQTRRRINMGQAALLLLLMAVLILALGGCDRGQADRVPDDTNRQETHMIVDSVGREVEVPVDPQRIACLCPEAGYALALYGQGDRIVATSGGMQRDRLLVEMYPHLKGLPIPKKNEVINAEELLRAGAQLVFVKRDSVTNKAEMDKLKKLKIPVVAMHYESMEEQQYAMQMVAEIVGCEEEGQKYLDFYRETVREVQQRTAEIKENERVSIYHSASEATRTDVADSLAGDWTKAAGVINVSIAEQLNYDDGNHYASLEQILLWDPDYILANDPNVVGYIMEHEQWRALKAVKNKRVLPLPIGISRWGHTSSLETPLAVLWTAKLAYPEQFEDWDMEETVRMFYKEFFDWELEDETITKILSGSGMRDAKS